MEVFGDAIGKKSFRKVCFLHNQTIENRWRHEAFSQRKMNQQKYISTQMGISEYIFRENKNVFENNPRILTIN